MDRRNFMQAGAIAALGTSTVPAWGRGTAGAMGQPIGPVQPYATAAISNAAYARHMGDANLRLLKAFGTDYQYGARGGARVQDAYTGKWYWDCHRVATTYNLGHRHPEIVTAVQGALGQMEIGNPFLISGFRALAADKLAISTGNKLTRLTFVASGSEANDLALRTARGFTARKGIVSLKQGFLGAAGLAMAASENPESSRRYLVDVADFVKVPFNDVAAMEAAVDKSTAAVIMESSPAQAGFPEPDPGYHQAVRRICDRHGAKLIIDECQTGLGASGTFWHWQQLGILPDMVTVAKGLGGGVMSNAAVLMAPEVGDWFLDTDMPHDSTFGGNELASIATSAMCDVTSKTAFNQKVALLIEQFRSGFRGAPYRVNQIGMCMGLIDERMSNSDMTRKLFDAGIVTVPASHNPHAVIVRPVLVLREAEAETIIKTVRNALG